MKPLRCPRCESEEVEVCEVDLGVSDERIVSTHECTRCHTRFTHTPPTPRKDRT